MATNERAFSAEFRKDLAEVYGDKIIVCLLPDMIRTGKKLFDFFVLYNGNFIGVECKIEHGKTFNVENKIKPHQFESLRKIDKCGGRGIFLIYFSRFKEAFVINPSRGDFGLYVEEPYQYEYLKNNYPRIKRIKMNGKTRWEVIDFIYHVESM